MVTWTGDVTLPDGQVDPWGGGAVGNDAGISTADVEWLGGRDLYRGPPVYQVQSREIAETRQWYEGRGEPVPAAYQEQLAASGGEHYDYPGAGGGTGVAMAGAVLPLSALIALLIARAGVLGRTVLVPAVRGLLQLAKTTARGGVARWQTLPAPVRFILGLLGFQVGTDLLIDTGPDDRGLLQLPGTSDREDMVGGVQVVGTWEANGVTFYRLADGRLAVQKANGVWRLWRPPKPIVLTRGGASNLRTFLKADRTLDRQAKKLRGAIGRRSPRRASSGERALVHKTEVRA